MRPKKNSPIFFILRPLGQHKILSDTWWVQRVIDRACPGGVCAHDRVNHSVLLMQYYRLTFNHLTALQIARAKVETMLFSESLDIWERDG
jgi:hypothetical protein